MYSPVDSFFVASFVPQSSLSFPPSPSCPAGHLTKSYTSIGGGVGGDIAGGMLISALLGSPKLAEMASLSIRCSVPSHKILRVETFKFQCGDISVFASTLTHHGPAVLQGVAKHVVLFRFFGPVERRK